MVSSGLHYGRDGFRLSRKLEPAGIEPASRDVSAWASTCVLADFQLSPSRPPCEWVPSGQGDLESSPGNRPAPCEQARCFRPSPPRGLDRADGSPN